MIAPELEKTIKRAFSLAKSRRHEYVLLEHLLHALTEDTDAADVLLGCGVDLDELRRRLAAYFDDRLTAMPRPLDPSASVSFQVVLELAAAQAQAAGRDQINGSNVLVALFREKNAHAVYFLRQLGVTRYDLLRYISHGLAPLESSEGGTAEEEQPEKAAPQHKPVRSALASYCVDLNAKARAGNIDPLIGRERELERAIHVLLRRKKNNPLFVGEAGVGKTALTEGLALRLVEGKVPPALSGMEIHALDLGSLMAGTKFRGEFEERLKAVVKELTAAPNRILAIDEIHTVIGAGSTSGSTLDASNLLKPVLADGQVKCIGSTTYKDYRTVFEKDAALSRRFQKIDLEEPSLEETEAILRGLRHRYEEFHRVEYTDEALSAAAKLAKRHLTDRFLPDKAIDVLDEAGAKVRLSMGEGKATVDVDMIEKTVATMARIPERQVSTEDRTRLQNLERDLKLHLYGQDQAIDTVVSAIQLSRAGLNEPDRPIGNFLFAGPTGVGKTELARQLALQLGVEFLRFDMSEYMEKHTVSRLIGSPPGYVGFDQGGQLTEAVVKHPHAVVLLDEIEKAHPDIFNILLQVMDYATLTDNNGRKADFRNVILIMTTNAGARESDERKVGFVDVRGQGTATSAIERLFSPEFRNRLSATVHFKGLDLALVERIVDKFCSQVEARITERGVVLELTPEARRHLAERGYNPAQGARPVRTLIEERISRTLSREILFGKLMTGGKVTVTIRGGELEFVYRKLGKAKQRPRTAVKTPV